ncbi:unnamed protein product [Sympodiomycopsis kandeliae]
MVLAAVTQLTSSSVISSNLSLVQSLIKRCSTSGAKMVFLPEATDFISSASEVIKLTYSKENQQFLTGVQESAKENNVWISVGIHEPLSSDKQDRCWNTQVVINDNGEIESRYRKLHLFDVDSNSKGIQIKESNTTQRGSKIESVVSSPIGKLGLLTCYDLRFPEASLTLRSRGAEIITYPSAFAVKTGLAHWFPLLQARAIETQSYVVAAAQIGNHPGTDRCSFGRAAIVDPWGVIIAQCSDATQDRESFALAEIDLSLLETIRTEMPLWEQRRHDVYPEFK